MFLFVVYALVVWALAARWRRRWGGAAVTVLGTLALIGLGWLHVRLNIWTDGLVYLPLLQTILYPYTVMVGGVSAFIALLPRTPGVGRCLVCHYDLAGLPGDDVRCPECGSRALLGPSAVKERRRQWRREQAEDARRLPGPEPATWVNRATPSRALQAPARPSAGPRAESTGS